MTLQEDVDELMQKLNKASNEALDFKGEIITNAKGEAQFKVRVYSNVASEIELVSKEILDGLHKICRDKGIKIAGS